MKKLLQRCIFYRSSEKVDFSFGNFFVFVAAQTVVFFALVYGICFVTNRDYLHVQLNSSWQAYLTCFLVVHLALSLFEYFFHRYMLHKEFWQWFGPLKRKHTEHHGITHVRELADTADDEGRAEVRNKYAITKPEQIKSSTFPAWSLVAFWGIFSLVFWPLQIALPRLPILFSGYSAVVFSFMLYEVIHAIEHLDYDKHWKPFVDRYRLVRNLYGFHLMHHSRDKVNQGIGGFCGLPIWDWIFGTYFVPAELPLPGARVTPKSQDPPPPRRLLRWLDERVAEREDAIKKQRMKEVLAKRS